MAGKKVTKTTASKATAKAMTTKKANPVAKTKAAEKDFVKIVENHLFVIVLVVLAAFALFAIGMAAGAAITLS